MNGIIFDESLLPEWVASVEQSNNFVFVRLMDHEGSLPEAVHLEWMFSAGLQYCGPAWDSNGFACFCAVKVK